MTDGLRCVTTDKNGIYHLPNLGKYTFCIYHNSCRIPDRLRTDHSQILSGN
ncbi:hypothetical protein NXV53_22755 [Bacteroides faecis]|nr:hypothetical protein [Bacteroides faecis]MCS3327217.1 hypothetical protein [Bacteroides faecis]